MNDELDKALEWADLLKADLPANLRWELAAAKEHAPTLADAVRSLREMMKAKDEEIAQWKDACTLITRDRDQWETKARKLLFKLQEQALNPSLDEALNSGDRRDKL